MPDCSFVKASLELRHAATSGPSELSLSFFCMDSGISSCPTTTPWPNEDDPGIGSISSCAEITGTSSRWLVKYLKVELLFVSCNG